jgi:structural maintenance of chromosome 4
MGDLGSIDDKYDIAISTACGGLDSIVVETVECGQKCIELLKRGNLGRATFICLDKTRKSKLSKIQTPENAPRLFDLIKTDNCYLDVFYQAIGDTLVATDLNQANRIAYGSTRYRVVTLDGQLIDKSGTMSGGGGRPSKGRMSSKGSNDDASPQVLASLEEELQRIRSKCENLSEKCSEMESDLNETKSSIDTCNRLQMTLKLDIDSLTHELEDAKKNLEIAK